MLDTLEAKSIKIMRKRRKSNLATCYARIMQEFHVTYSDFKVMPLPFFLRLIDMIAKQDKASKKANRKSKRK